MLIQVDTTVVFDKWFEKLKDGKARYVIGLHIERMTKDNMGTIRSVGQGIFEKKINYGPGYRLYFYQKGKAWILLLCGGDKSTQQKDINQARKIKESL